MFQALDGKGNQFLNLLDDNYCFIEPFYVKGGPWLQSFRHSNSLCVRASRAITNHAPIGEYGLDFSLGKNLNAHAVCIPSNLGDIFSMIAQDLMAIGIREETLLATLLCF